MAVHSHVFDLILSGATIVNADGERRANVGITAEKIAAILSPGETAQAHEVLSVEGCHLLPGLVDAHVHLREPGMTHKEDFDSGTRAAALGGVTTVLDMPTDDPWTASALQLLDKITMAQGRVHVDVGFQAVLSQDIRGLEELLALRPVSAELFTADVPEAFRFDTVDALTEMLNRLAHVRTLIGISPGNQSILQGEALREDAGDIAAFLRSRPPLAEANGVARAILAAASTKARIHVRQINSALGVGTWRRLRDMADATVETTPQNLFFTSSDYEKLGANLKGSPPLREQHDVEALRGALAEGFIDIVCTDHAPHSQAEKALRYDAFSDIPGGMPGLQTLLPTMLKLVGEGLIELKDLVRMCSRNPAERFGLSRSKGAIALGFDADIAVIDCRQRSQLTNAEQASRAGYTPFDGWTVPATLRHVFLRGTEIVRDGQIIARAGGKVVSSES
jgi:dihydroorotase